MAIGWNELVSALIGAAASGAFGIFDRRSERKHRLRSITNAASAHVKCLTKIIRQQGYLQDARRVLDSSRSMNWDGSLFYIDAKGDYLNGVRECARASGDLEPDFATQIIEFSYRAELFIDSTKPNGPFIEKAGVDEKRSHADETVKNIEALLELGDSISQMK
jgi:hypothetical protein